MIGFIKRLWRDRRGNALIIVGAAMPLVCGAAGLAVDTIQWTMWKRQLQRAADSAAYAGVYATIQDNPGMTAEQAIDGDLEKHNTTGIELLSGYPQIAYPTAAGYMDAVRVTLAVQKRLGFSSLFLSDPPTITVTATAAVFDAGTYCALARASTGPALIIGGSAHVDLGCGAISNSTDGDDSVDVLGASHTFIADPVAAVGAIDGTINGSPNLTPYTVPMDDPYEGLSTDVPSGMSCTNFRSHVVPGAAGTDENPINLTPGCFSTFNPGNYTYNLQPGTYYLNNVNLSLSGRNRLVGTGVTIILTGSDPGSLTMNGSSSMDLTAPTTGPYANLVLVQSANADVGNNNTINGDNGTALDGAIYFPNGDLTFSGSSAGATQCAMIVGWTLTFTGDADIQNDLSSCEAATQMEHKKVRLIV